MISETAKVYPGVRLGKNVQIEDFCIIGAPPRGVEPGEVETIIGDNAVIRSHTVIYAGNIIGNDFQTGNKVNIRENNKIGSKVSIGTLSVIEHHIEIADSVRIHSQAFIPEYSKLKKSCWIGPNVVLTNSKYPNQADSKETLAGPILEEGVRVGANATILPGVALGKEALVGAGSVVTKNVEGNTVVAGNPAKVIRKNT